VLSAFSLSSVFVSDDVRFLNNSATSLTGVTIYLQNTKNVVIKDAYFEGNGQTNIQIELGAMKVENSVFTDAKENIISGLDSVIKLNNVHMYNSTS
jgi:hypothetical protein